MLRRLTELASVQLAPNAGPMTLDGTNSYVLRTGPDAPVAIVDPGPEDAGHLAALAAAGTVELILITHWHRDHTEGSETLHRLTGAPVRSRRPDDCHGGEVLVDGERITVGDMVIDVVATPGHSADSTRFHLRQDRALPDADSADGSAADGAPGPDFGDAPDGSVLTGDTVLGRGTTVIGSPDGSLADYLSSMERIAALGRCRGLPAHGPVRPDLPATCRAYLEHRRERLDQVRGALARLGVDARSATIDQVTDAVYGDVDPAVRFAAEHSVAAQLAYLREPTP